MESSDGLLGELMARAGADPAFEEIKRAHAGAGIVSWLGEDEKALLFGVGAFAPGDGRIVEIGSYQGGSACFLAAGLRRRGRGRLTCIDPFLGGPLWLGMAPHQGTLGVFRETMRACGVEDWVDVRVGDSANVAAVWPGEPVSAVFIDGDHSFLGALRDFEAWLPKIVAGGLILVDNAADPGCPGVGELARLIETLASVRPLGLVGEGGNAVFRKNDVPAWEALDELGRACAARGVYRPWDMTPLHEPAMPPNYFRSRDWDDGGLDEPYQLAFLARCGRGDYGYTAGSRPADRAMIRALARDRGDGAVVKLGGVGAKLRGLFSPPEPRFRVILCAPGEARGCAPRLLPGGLLLARPDADDTGAFPAGVRAFHDAGLEGAGLGNRLIHGIWQPQRLTPDTIFANAMAAVRGEPGRARLAS